MNDEAAPGALAPRQDRLIPVLLIGTAVLLTAVIIVVPMVFILYRALAEGWRVYAANILEPSTLHAIWLTALVAVIVVPINTAFGVAAA